MEFRIEKFSYDNNWFIYLYSNTLKNNYTTKEPIAKELGLDLEEYGKILLDNGANIFHYINSNGKLSNNIGYEFKTKEDAQKVIEILNSYLVMEELLK